MGKFLFKACWPCCRLHPDPFREKESAKNKLVEAATEQQKQDDAVVELIHNREFEVILVFNNGRSNVNYNSLQDERKRKLFEYMKIPGGAPNEASFTQKTDNTERAMFTKFINKTTKALKNNGFHVKLMNKNDHPADVQSEIDGKYTFMRVGMTEGEYRKWAQKSDFRLEIDPLMTIEWLRVNGDRLAEATINEDKVRGQLLSLAEWEHIYVAYHKGTPQQVFRDRQVTWPDDPRLGDWSIFRTADKVKLIVSKIEAPEEAGGADIDMGGLEFLEDHPLRCHFPLHIADEEAELYKKIKTSLFDLPVDEIREYYGEYIAIYFAFLQYMNYALLFPTLIGSTVFVLQLTENQINNRWSVFLAVAMVFWGQIVIEGWKYKEYVLQKQWGQSGFRKDPLPRPEFQGEWIWSPINGQLIPYFDPLERAHKCCISYSVVALCIALLIGNIVAIAALRVAIDKHVSEEGNWQPTAFGIFAAIQIIIFDTLYTILSIYLNDFENHKTDLEYENGLIVKNFVFRFVNSYNALFYVAFAKMYVDGCEGNGTDGCFDELRISLATIFGTQIIIGNITEVGIPYLMAADTSVTDQSEIWDQFSRSEYDGTFEDFCEIILQFGYATVFIIAFPLAAALALLSYLLEVQVDAYKFHKLERRPLPQGTSSIHPWTGILTIMGWLSTISNLVIILVLSKSFEGVIGMDHVSVQNLILAGIVAEHIIIFLFLIVIPKWNAQPDSIKRHFKRQQHIDDSLKMISLELQGELLGWRDWSKKEFSNFLKSEGKNKREKVIDTLSDIDGKALQKITSADSLRKNPYFLTKKESKWAYGLIEDLTAQDKETERAETFARMLKLRTFAQSKKNMISEDLRPTREIYRGFSVWDFGSWLDNLSGVERKRIWFSVVNYYTIEKPMEAQKTMREMDLELRRQYFVGQVEEQEKQDEEVEEEPKSPLSEEDRRMLKEIPSENAISAVIEISLLWFLSTTHQNQQFRLQDEEQKKLHRKITRWVMYKWNEFGDLPEIVNMDEDGFRERDFEFVAKQVKKMDFQDFAALAEELSVSSDAENLYGHLYGDVSLDEGIDLKEFDDTE